MHELQLLLGEEDCSLFKLSAAALPAGASCCCCRLVLGLLVLEGRDWGLAPFMVIPVVVVVVATVLLKSVVLVPVQASDSPHVHACTGY